MAVSDALIGGLLGGGIAGALINALHQRGEAFRQRRYTAAEAYLSDMDDARAALDDLVDIIQGKVAEDLETPADTADDVTRRLRHKNIRRAKVLLEGKPLKDRCNELESLARRHLRLAQVTESRLSLLFSDRTKVLPAAAILTNDLQQVHTTVLEEMQKAQKEMQKAKDIQGADSFKSWEERVDWYKAWEELQGAKRSRDQFASYARRVVNSSALWAAAANSAQDSTPYRWWRKFTGN